MTNYTFAQLNEFIVKAKSGTYVGDGIETKPNRLGSRDLQFVAEPFSYIDSYFGSKDFIGQEVVYHDNRPIWGMNYYGRILRADLITNIETGKILKTCLSQLYKEGRFLGGYKYKRENWIYNDENTGNIESFIGNEWIIIQNEIAYRFDYHGGLIKE